MRVLILVMCGVLASCSGTTVKRIDPGMSVIDFSANRRGAYIVKRPKPGAPIERIFCAEPSPDVANNIKGNFSAELEGLDKAQKAKASAELTKEIVKLAERSQTVQIQREALYRLCELNAAVGLTDEQMVRLFSQVLGVIQTVAIGEFANSLPEVERKDAVKSLQKFLKNVP